MTELRDELKPRPEESGMEWTRRTVPLVKNGAFTEEERRRHSPYLQFPDETADEFFARQKQLHEMGEIEQADDERDRERRQERATENEAASLRKKEEGMAATEESSQRFRIKAQERDAEKAVSEFETAKERLYRGDGSKVYGEEEHAERLATLTGDLREKAEAVSVEAEKDVIGYEREALALSYTDFASLVPASDRGRLEASRVFVKEDCETLAAPALTQRLEAVSAGSDKVAPVLFARYGRRRLEALEAESSRLAGEGRPAGADKARENRALGEAVASLEAALEDPQKVKRVQGLKEAAEESRRVARAAKTRLSELDGTGEAARERQRVATMGVF